LPHRRRDRLSADLPPFGGSRPRRGEVAGVARAGGLPETGKVARRSL